MSDTARLNKGEVETLRSLEAIAATLDVQDGLMLIGATARLLMLDWPLNLNVRTTVDVDFIVQVKDWAQYKALLTRMLENGFKQLPQEHRLQCLATGTLIDLIPFGGLENPEGTIRWPRSEREMSVWGMLEAHHEASVMELAPGLKIRVVSLPCLVALKLFAWMDRRYSHKGHGDLADANFILSHCYELSAFEQNNWDAFAKAAEIAESLGRIDKLVYTEHVGAVIIGDTLKAVLRPETKSHLNAILRPLAEDEYHPAIEQSASLFSKGHQYREAVSLRFAILSQCLMT